MSCAPMARPATRRDRYPGARPFADDPIDQRLYFGRTREAQEVFHRVLAEPLFEDGADCELAPP